MKFYFLLVSYFSLGALVAQILNVETKCQLDQNIKESSGIITPNFGRSFWTHNDSENQARLFEIDSNCQLLKTVFVKNAKNEDWEDITYDGKGNIFVGDFGNNENKRKKLEILKLSLADMESYDSVTAEKIIFSYTEQIDFPPTDSLKEYDMEGFFWFQDSLHLFSKNRTKPFNGLCRHYVISDQAGEYFISPKETVTTNTASIYQDWITGACISPNGKYVFLLSYDRVWLFDDFKDSNFFAGRKHEIPFSTGISQKEGICFNGADELWLTEESIQALGTKANLYRINIRSILESTVDVETKHNNNSYILNGTLHYPSTKAFLKFANTIGQIFILANIGDNVYDCSDLPRGLYFITNSDKSVNTRFLKW